MILALETSCDDTCAAVVTPAGEVLANVVSSQGVHAAFGGAGVVARGLEREDHNGAAFGTSSSVPRSVAGVRHMITASSPLSA